MLRLTFLIHFFDRCTNLLYTYPQGGNEPSKYLVSRQPGYQNARSKFEAVLLDDLS